MTIVSLVFVMVTVVCMLEQTHGFGTYVWPYASPPAALSYPQVQAMSALIPADCDKKGEGDSSESSSSESSSSESSSSESKEGSKEGGEGSSSSSSSSSEEIKVGGEEGETGEGGGSGEEGAKKEGGSEESGGESEEKKEVPKKKKSKKQKGLFSPLTYTFPPRSVQELIYTAPATYQYWPYRSTYSVVQQPASYISEAVPKVYPASYVRSIVNAPITRVISNPASKLSSPIIYNVPAVTGFSALNKGYVASPGAPVVSAPATYWAPSSRVSYYKV